MITRMNSCRYCNCPDWVPVRLVYAAEDWSEESCGRCKLGKRWKNNKTGKISYRPPGKGRKKKEEDEDQGEKQPEQMAEGPLQPEQPKEKPPEPNTRQGLQALVKESQQELSDRNHPINSGVGSRRQIKAKGSNLPTVMSVVDDGRRRLSSNEHTAMARYHQRLSKVMAMQGKQDLAKSQALAARYHQEQAAAKANPKKQPQQAATAPKQTPVSKEQEQHRQSLRAAGQKLQESLKHLSPAKGKEYHTAAMQALSRLNPKALQRVMSNIRDFSFHENADSLRLDCVQSVIEHGLKSGILNASHVNADFVRSVYEGFQHAAGGYMGEGRKVILDGGTDGTSTNSIYAHEFTHAVDGPGNEISKSDDWSAAWKQEAVGVSEYAMTAPNEGFAEFGRVLFEKGPEYAAARFPKMHAVWKKHGIV